MHFLTANAEKYSPASRFEIIKNTLFRNWECVSDDLITLKERGIGLTAGPGLIIKTGYNTVHLPTEKSNKRRVSILGILTQNSFNRLDIVFTPMLHLRSQKSNMQTHPSYHRITVILILSIISLTSYAQTKKLIQGDLLTLQAVRSMNIVFTYDSMIIGAGTSETEYLRERERRWNEREPGKGAAFVKKWFDDRKRLYEPAFIKNFEQHAPVKLGDPDAQYTMVVKTMRTEGGWDIGIGSKKGEIDGELWIVESSNHDKIIAKIGFYEFMGKSADGGDFGMTLRIRDAYVNAGWVLGSYIKKHAKMKR